MAARMASRKSLAAGIGRKAIVRSTMNPSSFSSIRSKRDARLSFVNGASNTVPLPTASRKPAHACSASPACLPNNGKARAPPMRSSGCTRSSSDGSRRRPCCLPPKPLQCCSGLCWPPARSTCAKSTAGKRSPQSPSLSQLTSPPDKLCSNSRSLRYANSHHIPDGTALCRFGD